MTGIVPAAGGGAGSLRYQRTIYKAAADLTTASLVFVDIDAVHLPPLSLSLAAGTDVELRFEAGISNDTSGSVVKIDWLITQPDTTTTSIRQLTGADCAGAVVADSN